MEKSKQKLPPISYVNVFIAIGSPKPVRSGWIRFEADLKIKAPYRPRSGFIATLAIS